MTESLTDPGRDDVLAQVRNLVKAVPTPKAPEPKSALSAGRLLLTPALRVADPSNGQQSAEPARPRRMSLEDRIAELEAAVGSQSQDWEPDGSEDLEPHIPDKVIYARPRAANTDVNGPKFGHRTDADMAEDAPEIAADGFVLTDALSQKNKSAAPQDDPEPAEEAKHISVDLDDDPNPSEGGVVSTAFFSHARRSFRPVPEDQQADPVEEMSDPQISDAVDDDAAALPEDEAQHEVEDIDEERLRQIVREVLLEELTGPLGEKMTRNIRKMLRREVDRAMSLREFE